MKTMNSTVGQGGQGDRRQLGGMVGGELMTCQNQIKNKYTRKNPKILNLNFKGSQLL